jgi:hypothetical protein
VTLYFFRTRAGWYGLARWQPDELTLYRMDYWLEDRDFRSWVWAIGRCRPRSLPAIELGECIPVTLAVAGRGKSKPKRARKGG